MSMGFDQKMDNVLGRLEIIVPSLEANKVKVDDLTTKTALIDQRLDVVERKVEDHTPSGAERRNRIWDVITLVLSNLIGAGFTYTMVQMGQRLQP